MKPRTHALEKACKEFEADLVLYYYGDDCETDHVRVDAHCSECARCRRFLDDLRQLLPQMAQPKEMPGTFWDSYYNEMVQKLAAERQQRSSRELAAGYIREFLRVVRADGLVV